MVYLIFGIYFLNEGFDILNIPESLSGLNEAMLIIGGALLIIGAINVLRINRLKQPRLF